MHIDSVLLFLLVLRYAYEKKPLAFGIMGGLLKNYPETLPEGAQTPLEIVKIIDKVLYSSEEEHLTRSVQLLQSFASRFA